MRTIFAIALVCLSLSAQETPNVMQPEKISPGLTSPFVYGCHPGYTLRTRSVTFSDRMIEKSQWGVPPFQTSDRPIVGTKFVRYFCVKNSETVSRYK